MTDAIVWCEFFFCACFLTTKSCSNAEQNDQTTTSTFIKCSCYNLKHPISTKQVFSFSINLKKKNYNTIQFVPTQRTY